MRKLTESLNSAQEVLELLIELVGTEPRFLRRQIMDVVGATLQIAEAESLEEGTQHLAIEFVITLAETRERAPGMMRKLPQFISSWLFANLLKMLLDVEDDPAWHSAKAKDEDAVETSNYSVGQECLQRLSIALGGNTIVPVASEQFQAYFSAPEWQKHHIALIALAQIAEGCSKVMVKNLEQVVNMVLNTFQHPDQHGVEYLSFFRELQTHTRSSYSSKEEDDEKVIALGGIIFVPVASKQSQAYFSAPEWQKHHTDLIALAQIAEGCSKLMVKNLEQVVNMVLSSFQHRHPHVKWAAINAIGQLSTGLGPDLQIQFHQHALPALAADMDDFQNPRVQAHAASAVRNFSENCTPEILTPYLDGIVHKLLLLLQIK